MLISLAGDLALIVVEILAGDTYDRITNSQRRSLQSAYEQAFLAMLQRVERAMRAAGEVSQADLEIVGEVMEAYCRQPAVRAALLDVALRDQPLDAERMAGRFRTVDGPRRLRNIHFDLDDALTTFQAALKNAMDDEAAKADSPLFNWWATGVMRDVKEGQAVTHAKLDEIIDGQREQTIIAAPPIPATPPRPPRHFTGRQSYIDEIKAKLTAGERTAIVALQGMGGIGKTALAQKLAAELKEQLPGGIFWAALRETGGSAERILHVWGAHCGVDLSPEQNVTALAGLVRGLLERRTVTDGPLAAIIDDVRKDWLDDALRLVEALPDNTPVLLTTRDERLAGFFDADVVRLDLLPASEARDLLQNHAGEALLAGQDATVDRLLKVLGYLPLAIKLAGGYLATYARKPGFGLAQFTDMVTREAAAVLDDEREGEAGRQPGLVATFRISYDALKPGQQRLYRRLSIYSPPLLTMEHILALVPEDGATVEKMVSSSN